MDAYRKDTAKVQVTLRLRGSMEFKGCLFLPADPADEPTTRRLKSQLNSFDAFVPFEMSEGLTVVHNKERLLWCRFEGPPGPTLEILLPRRRVTLVLEDQSILSGDLVADGPPDRRRVLDCLNGSDQFLLVEGREHDYLVRRDAIAYVPSAELGEAPDGEEVPFEMESPAPAAS